MKKILLPIICIFLISFILIFNSKTNNNGAGLKKIKVAEVTHSIFYTPLYLAEKLGYFNDNGLDVEIILTSGADKVAAAVISKDVDIGLCGGEQSIYIYNQGSKDYLINFAGLTKKDGSFLIGRQKKDTFDIKQLNNSKILGGRNGGMPAMTLNYTLHKNNIKANVDTSIDFSNLTSSFISGNGDFVSVFEPNGLILEKQNKGYVVLSLGEIGGNVPYTTFNALKSYIENNGDTIDNFKNAIDRALDYTKKHSSSDIANLLIDYFPDIEVNELIEIVNRYKNIDAWYETTLIPKKDYEHMQDIIEYNGFLKKRVEYEVINYG